MIKNLAIKGGGVRGIAYVGALYELEKHQILQGIQRFAGTSAGALVAAMLAVGFSAKQIEDLMHSLDFKKFESGANPLRIFASYGLYSGDYILNFIRSFLSQTSYKEKLTADVTFKEMKEVTSKDLYVFACNVNSQLPVELSADKTPDVIVAEAVRASMSIPFFFKAFQFSKGLTENHIFVDGGVVFNYPLSFYDQPSRSMNNAESLGLYLYAPVIKPIKNLGKNTPMFFAKQLFESLMDAQDVQVSEDQDLLGRSIMIDDLRYPATDFSLSSDDMNKLIESGRTAAQTFVQKLNSSTG